MRNGRAYALQTSGPRTSGSGCSSLRTWNTPSTEDHKSDGPIVLDRYERGEALTCDMRLRNQAMTWTGPDLSYQKPLPGETSKQYWRRMAIHETIHGITPEMLSRGTHGNHPGAVDSLTGATRNWATPNTPSGGPNRKSTPKHTGGLDLDGQAELWQTPATDSFRSRGGDRKDEMGLDQQARMFPTPTMSDATRGNFASKEKRTKGGRGKQLADQSCIFRASPPAPQIPDGPQSCENTPGLRPPSRRRLNPEFVTWLMNFPAWWTDVD